MAPTSVEFPEEHRALVARSHDGVLATLRRNGRPQLSNITYHFDPARDLVRISVTGDRAKTRNVARDPRVSMNVSSSDFWSYVVLEGEASVSPVAADPADATVEELVDQYRSIRGEHSDWQEFRQAMIDQQRRVLSFTVQRSYGLIR